MITGQTRPKQGALGPTHGLSRIFALQRNFLARHFGPLWTKITHRSIYQYVTDTTDKSRIEKNSREAQPRMTGSPKSTEPAWDRRLESTKKRSTERSAVSLHSLTSFSGRFLELSKPKPDVSTHEQGGLGAKWHPQGLFLRFNVRVVLNMTTKAGKMRQQLEQLENSEWGRSWGCSTRKEV